QSAVYRVALRIVLGMPLNAEGKAFRARDTDGLDGSIFRDTFHDDSLARLENTLTMKTIDADRLLAEEAREYATWDELHLMAISKNDGRIGVDLAILQPRHSVVHAPRQLPDFGMKRAAKGDVHLLKAPAEAKDRHVSGDTNLGQYEG